VKRFGKIVIKNLIDLFELIIIGGAVFAFTYIFAGQLLRVTGDSMLPNFHDGEQIVAEKVTVKFENLKRGDIVIFQHPSNPDRLIIKRVIGLPGETIKLVNGQIFINGQILKEPYLTTESPTLSGNYIKDNVLYTIPTDAYIFLGDNRSNSTDSRDWGPINKNLVVGKAFLVYYPFNELGLVK
jgi:signal peptidase I